MPYDRYPNLDVAQLEALLEVAQNASVKGAITSVSAAGVSTTRDMGKSKDTDTTIKHLMYSLYLRTGGDPRYPNPYGQRITRTRTVYSQTQA